MGATVSVAQTVAAYTDRLGRPIYVLFESTYEKNCYPHVPHWGAVGFGTADTVIDRIFLLASETCGGMLQGPGGQIQPVGYAQKWLGAMAIPGRYHEMRTSLELRDLGSIGYIPTDKAEKVLAALTDSGHKAVAERLSKGEKVDLSFVDDVETLMVIATVLAPWRFIGSFVNEDMAPTAPDLWYRPEPSATMPVVDYPGIYRLTPPNDQSGLDHIVIEQDGRLTISEPEYMVLARFVEKYASCEKASPGHFGQVYRRLKAHMAGLPQLPPSTLVKVDPTRASKAWAANALKAAQALGPLGKRFGDFTGDQSLLTSLAWFPEAVTLTTM